MVIQGTIIIPNNINDVAIAILKGAVNEAAVSSVIPSRAVRMSPRLAKKRNSQLRISSSIPSATSVMRSYRKENTTAISISGGRSVTTSNQRPFLPAISRGSRGRRSITSSVSVVSSTRTSRRGSSKCNHSSFEVCNYCTQR